MTLINIVERIKNRENDKHHKRSIEVLAMNYWALTKNAQSRAAATMQNIYKQMTSPKLRDDVRVILLDHDLVHIAEEVQA